MKSQKRPLRLTLFAFLLVCLLTGLTGITHLPEKVEAAPQEQVMAGGVVISEFRFLGPLGANDEFVELYNPTSADVPIGNWELRGSNNSGSTSVRATIPGGTTLGPGKYYLIVNSGASSGLLALQDLTYSTGITDDGGVALTTAGGGMTVDAVGLSSGSAYKEGTSLTPLSGTANQSYERKLPGEIRNCVDTNNNAADFTLNASSINPQNSSSPAVSCLYVTDIMSTKPNGTYTTAGETIDIQVTFSLPVFISGTPTLQLETGVTDRNAVYQSGSGSNVLTFQYTTVLGDYSTDLDYVSTAALSGAIYDTIGNAILALPTPGSADSIAGQKAIVINIDDGQPPRVLSIKRQNPTTSLTRVDTLTFRVTFSENIDPTTISQTDFTVHTNNTPPTTTATVTGVTGGANIYDVTVSGGDLAGFNGVVGLDLELGDGSPIKDLIGNTILSENLTAANDETYNVDNTNPGVIVNRANSQADPTGVTPINFSVVFSEPIVVSTFTVADIIQSPSPGSVTWSITPSNDRKTFTLSATAVTQTNLILTPTIGAGAVTDDAGNPNNASSSTTDPDVVFTDVTAPTVTVNQASGQSDPTTALPVRFSVLFSERINTSLFTTSDITQSGTATGITWALTNPSGDGRTFILSATAVTGGGTLIPSISANRVTDIAGNGNVASTSSDNSVRYGPPPTPTITPTRTPTPVRTATRTRTPTLPPTVAPPQLVAINEFVPRPGHDWNNDGEVNVQDEYIEIINHGTVNVNLSGYSLDDEANIGSDPYRLPATVIQPGERIVFYGSETGLLLSDGGDGVRLLKPNGQLMDAYNYTVARYPDQSFCRLPDDGGLDDWNQNCYPTPGLQNSLNAGVIFPPDEISGLPLCPIADTLPDDFVYAECSPYGHNIWRREYWDETGWYDEMVIPGIDSRWEVFAD